MPGLPRYKCHKEVSAVKIKAVIPSPSVYDPADQAEDGGFIFHVSSQEGVVLDPIRVSKAYLAKHQPTVGGYYVLYDDGYESFSPAAAFEAGYTLCEPSALELGAAARRAGIVR